MPAGKYSLKDIMAETTKREPIYGYPKGFISWIKRKLGFKVEKVILGYTSDLRDLVETLMATNELMKVMPFYEWEDNG